MERGFVYSNEGATAAKINLNPKMFIEQLISSLVNSLCWFKHGSLEENEKDD